MSLSPDDSSVVYDEAAPRSGAVDLYRFDFATGQTPRLTFNAAHDMFPVWSGRSIFFNSLRAFPPQLLEIDADSTGNERQILQSPSPLLHRTPATLPPPHTAPGPPRFHRCSWRSSLSILLQSQRAASLCGLPGVFNAEKSYEVVRPSVSNDGWPAADLGRRRLRADRRRDGKELFFLAPNRTLMAVEFTGTGATFNPSRARPLFPTAVQWLESQAIGRHYAPSRDGKRFC